MKSQKEIETTVFAIAIVTLGFFGSLVYTLQRNQDKNKPLLRQQQHYQPPHYHHHPSYGRIPI